ncbi:MAG TPA: DUF5819 family protein [Thermoanaerobaculia bacterium]|nr:DUF5819 family protein [Thermoanaerobaculia bacterium]
MRANLSAIGWWAAFGLLGLAYCVHFSLVQLSNMPLSPLTLNLDDVIRSYVSPYFNQRWNFFSPQPVQRDIIVVSRGRYRDPKTGGEVITPWTDISPPLIASVKKHRLTPLFLVEIGLSNASTDYENKLGSDSRASFEKDGKNFLRQEIPASVDPLNLSVMTRTALATLQIDYPGTQFEAVQLGLVHYTYPRFTERHKKEARPQQLPLTLIEWQAARPVTPYCCAK